MATLENRPNTALLVIDVQNGIVGEAYERDTVVANVGSVVERARAEEVPVVWVQHSSDNLAQGSEEWKIVPELSPDSGEPLVEKRYPDSFEETTLESVLGDLGVGRLAVVGAQTDECVRSTLHGALVRGYDATLVSDAHTTEDLSPWGAPPPEPVIAHTNLYWSNHELQGGRPERSKRRTSTSRHPDATLRGVRVATVVLFAAAFVLLHGEATAAVTARTPLLAAFGKRSYRPGQVAVLRIDSSPLRRLTLRLFLAGGTGAAAVPLADRDRITFGR